MPDRDRYVKLTWNIYKSAKDRIECYNLAVKIRDYCVGN